MFFTLEECFSLLPNILSVTYQSQVQLYAFELSRAWLESVNVDSVIYFHQIWLYDVFEESLYQKICNLFIRVN